MELSPASLFGYMEDLHKLAIIEHPVHRSLKQKEAQQRKPSICNKTFASSEKAQSCFEEGKNQGSELQLSDWILLMTRRDTTEHYSLKKYTNQQRKLLREQAVIKSKQDTLEHMQTALSTERKRIHNAQKTLEEKTLAFQDFRMQVKRNLVETMKVIILMIVNLFSADRETRARLQLEADIRKVRSEIVSFKSDIAKDEETLKQYKEYADFLYMLSPPEWREAQEKTKEERRAAKKATNTQVVSEGEKSKLMKESCEPKAIIQSRRFSYRKSSVSGRRPSRRSAAEVSLETCIEDKDSDEELELYFTDPQQLIQMIKELEENLFHSLKNLEEEEEHLEVIIQRESITKKHMNQKIEKVLQSKETLVNTLAKEKEELEALELKIKMFSFGDLTATDQDELLSKLTKLIAEVYRSCVGETQATIDPLEMLASIETNVIELEQKLEAAPRELVQAVRMEKNKEMRKRVREEKLRQRELNRAARSYRMMARATAEPPKIIWHVAEPYIEKYRMEHIPESRPVSPTSFSVDSASLSNFSLHDHHDHNNDQE
ncbi:cilia- and flagella-associated protein 100-like [Gastrophryne carolinensis]